MELDRGGSAAPVASLMEISRVLEETARLVRERASRTENPLAGSNREGPVGARQVRAILALRGLRREYLGRDFSEGAWAMLLEVYAARLEGRSVNQSLVGFETGIPPTTALATVRRLLDRGVFLKETDPSDKRMVLSPSQRNGPLPGAARLWRGPTACAAGGRDRGHVRGRRHALIVRPKGAGR